ncbi:MAG: sugar phosphate isomerase/epimerase [Clostridia bacterium]|nr:sugar phosphate isomerase/epimerase [Clostridia bacterium]
MDKRIGAQLFTVRDLCKSTADLDATLGKIAKIGYKCVQVSGVGVGAADVREILDKYSLEPICTHRPYADYRDNIDAVIEYQSTLSCSIAGLGMMPEEMGNSSQSLNEFIKVANRATQELSKRKMCFAYHNHAFEFMRLDGKYIMDYLIENTDMKFILDVYWLAFAAQDPAKMIERLGKRAVVLHYKDLKIKGFQTAMAPVGSGNLNWDEILAAADMSGAEYAMVEQDYCDGDPIDALKTSYNFLTQRGYV